jgi:asparagine synthase (glutamine-hydrolysing)
VLLTGDGGDDVFLGYPGHLHFLRAQKIGRMLPPELSRAWYTVRKSVSGINALRRGIHFIDYATGGIGAVVHAKDGLPFYARHGLLGPRLAGIGLAERELEWSPESGRNVLSEFLAYEHSHRFYAEYMTKVDGGAMYYALEARSPFLDQEMWNFAAGLPYETRLYGGKLKAVLRELARRKLGDRVATGAKRGFTIPVTHWMAGKWERDVRAMFEESVLAQQGWIDAQAALREMDRSAERGSTSDHLWYLYVLESWFRNQMTVSHRSGLELVAG